MLSFECIKNEKSVYFLLTSAEKNILRYIISKIKQIGHIEILMHLLPKFS